MIRRFPRYYRHLSSLQKRGVYSVSSKDLSEQMGITPSQIRKDFAHFGGDGLHSGYEVGILKNKIANFLGLGKTYNMVIIGAGSLGRALMFNKSFEKEGFQVIGIFDTDADVIGEKIETFKVEHLDCLSQFVKHQNIDIAVIAVPNIEAIGIIHKVISFGIKGIWNFSPVEVRVPNDVAIENTCLGDSLMILGYHLKKDRTQQSCESPTV